MTDGWDKTYWNKSDCEFIIKNFIENKNICSYENENRKYKRFILLEKYKDFGFHWVWDNLDYLIKNNLGDNYYLSTWVIGLKYTEGDYFLEHQDDYGNKKDRLLSGGIELSDSSDYVGGDYIVEGKSLKAKQGFLFTHSPSILHEITEIKKGTRYSLHFCISKKSGQIL